MTQKKSKKIPDYLKRKCFVRWGEDQIEVLMDPDEPTIHLKEQLEKETGIAIPDQRIFYNGIKKPFEDDKSLRFYGAQGGGFFDLARDEDLDEDMNIIRKPVRRVSLEISSQLEATKLAAKDNSERLESYRGRREQDMEREKILKAQKEAQEEAERLAKMEALRKRKEEEARKMKEEVEAKLAEEARQKAEQERLQREEDERKAAEAKRLAELEAARLAKEEQERLEAQRLAEEEAARRAAEEEAARKAAEEEAARKAAEEEAARKAAEEEAARKAAEEAERLAREEQARLEAQKLAEEEAARKKAEEERRKAEEEAAAAAAEKLRLEEEAEKRRLEEEAAEKLRLEQEQAEKERLEQEEAAKKAAKKEKKEKKKKKKKDDGNDSDDSWFEHKKKDYHLDFTPTEQDLSRFKIWFMIGDLVPFEMICPIAMDIKGLKVEVLKLRNEAKSVQKYLEGLEDPNELRVYAAGSWGEGEPLADDLPVPRDSSPHAFFSVMR